MRQHAPLRQFTNLVGPALARLPDLAPFVYFCLALPVVVFHTFALPPFQAADEENHFLRAVQLSRGYLIGTRASDVSAGGRVDTSAASLSHRFDYLKFRPDIKIDQRGLMEARAVGWTKADRTYIPFGNTVIYPPYLYAPAVAGLKIGQILNLSVINSLYVARLATAFCAVSLSAIALALAGSGHALLFATLSLPMVLSLFASCTQDALGIAFMAVVVALCARAYRERQALSRRAGVLAGVLLGAVVAARPPYAPFLGLLVLRPFSGFAGRSMRSTGAAMAAPLGVATLIILSWTVLVIPLKVPFRPDEGVSTRAQAAYLLGHPAAIVTIAANTASQYAGHYFEQFVGVLGWLDTNLPASYYPFAGSGLLGACLINLLSRTGSPTRGDRLLIVATVLIAVIAIFAAQYLAWTKVGADFVDGVQGRYLFAPALVLSLTTCGALAAGDLRHRFQPTEAVLGLAWASLYVFALANLWVVPRTLMMRYYG